MGLRDEPAVVVAIFIHEEEADVFQTEVEIVDLLRHDPIGLSWSDRHDEFFAACAGKELFAKVVFDSAITDEEISSTAELAKKYGLELVLSPVMLGDKMSVTTEFISTVLDKYLKHYDRVRVIPQVHKFIGVE